MGIIKIIRAVIKMFDFSKKNEDNNFEVLLICDKYEL